MAQRTVRATAFPLPSKQQRIVFRDICGFAADSFRADKVRATMTALGMVIGTASLILVVTVALTGKQFLLTQIQNVGANLIWVEYSSQSNAASNAALRDYLTADDMSPIQRQVPGIRAASPVLNLHDRIAAPGGKERDTPGAGRKSGIRRCAAAASALWNFLQPAGLTGLQQGGFGNGGLRSAPIWRKRPGIGTGRSRSWACRLPSSAPSVRALTPSAARRSRMTPFSFLIP